jgi:hypothetical protein
VPLMGDGEATGSVREYSLDVEDWRSKSLWGPACES